MPRPARRDDAAMPAPGIADVVRRLNDAPARRLTRNLARGVAALADAAGRAIGAETLPHRVARRAGWVLAARSPRIAIVEPALAGAGAGGLHVLLVSHTLGQSGAPRIVTELAAMLAQRGDRVTVLTGEDGPRRAEVLAIGATVIVDPAVARRGAPLAPAIAGGFDVALCNTVAVHRCAAAIAPLVPTILYTHETTLTEQLLATSPALRRSLAAVAQLWAGSELSAALVRPIRPDAIVMPYGLDPLTGPHADRAPVGSREPVTLGVFGSFEPRKGQDLLVEAVTLLDQPTRARLRLRLYGSILERDFHAALAARVAAMPEISLHGPLDAPGYGAALLAGDAVIVPSRSDTLPLVSLDALGAARPLLCTRSTGTSAYIEDGVSGFVAQDADAASIAAMLARAIARRDDWPAIAAAGREVFARRFSRAAFAAAVTTRLDAEVAGR